MKKSEIYKYAQCAVLEAHFTSATKLEILRLLMEQEDVALYVEKKEEEKENDEC